MKKLFLFCLIISCGKSVWSQSFQFRPDAGLAVKDTAFHTLAFPWAGGIGAGQFQQMDLNSDGLQDLVVFDRGDSRLMTWIRAIENGQIKWHFRPDYAACLPKITNWFRLLDYDNDGKTDLITANNGSVDIYKNVSTGTVPQFQRVIHKLTADFGFGPGFMVPVYVLNIDYPGIDDLDGDGDVDILAFDSFDTGMINYYRNMAAERYSRTDTFDMLVTSRCYGLFYENQNSSAIIMNLKNDCSFPDSLTTGPPALLRPSHVGSTILPIKFNKDTLSDLILGDFENPRMSVLFNNGTRDTARITQATVGFPNYDTPSYILNFPGSFTLDLKGSSKKDLIITTNDPYDAQFGKHVWFYENQAIGLRDSFALQTRSFLIEDILQYHHYASPAFIDADNDGDKDLLVAHYTNALVPVIHFYEKGTAGYQLTDTNFLQIKDTLPGRIRLAAGDLNGDGKEDLLIGTQAGPLAYYRNTSTPSGVSFFYETSDFQQIQAGTFTSPELADVNGDGKIDLLVGNQNGHVLYFENTGTAANPVFVKQSDSLGSVNVSDNLYVGNAVPRLADINNNGNPDLIVGNQWGKLYFYADIRTQLTGVFTSSNESFYYPSVNITSACQSGSFISPAFTDIDGDNLPDLFIGNYRGGVEFYRNTTTLVSVATERLEKALRVYPNPVSDKLMIELTEAGEHMQLLQLFDLQGRQIHTQTPEEAHRSVLSMNHLPAGIYLLETRLSNQQRVFRRIVKEH